MEFFSEEELQLALANVGQKYTNRGPVYDAFVSINKKLAFFADFASRELGIQLVQARKERLDKSRGRGKGWGFRDYILVGYAPVGQELDKMLFVKFEVLFYEGKPKFKFEFDYDFASKKNKAPLTLRKFADSIRSKPLIIPWDRLQDRSWEGLFQESKGYLKKAITDYKKSYAYHQAGSVPQETPNTEPEEKMNPNAQISPPINCIYYGPPGTGKTYLMQHLLLPKYRDQFKARTREEFLDSMVVNLNWWESIAIALLDIGKPVKVPEIEQHEVVQARLRLSSTTNPRAIIWGQLQAHTPHDCENVNFTNRMQPYIFWKGDKSDWSILLEAVEEQTPELKGMLKNLKNYGEKDVLRHRYDFVTFHQGFAYEDFVEGIKPVLQDENAPASNLGFYVEEGIFYRACLSALRLAGFSNFEACLPDQDNREPNAARLARYQKFAAAKPYALFIDEINRANVSAVFGELITLLEPDKRLGMDNEIVLRLPYSKTRFAVPPNLHVYGTMNTADRSVEALDTALRRRFTFREMMPMPDLLGPGHLIWLLWQANVQFQWDSKEWKAAYPPLFDFLGVPEDFAENKKMMALYEKLTVWNAATFEDAFPAANFTGVRLDLLLDALNMRLERLLDRDHCLGHSFFIGIATAENPLEYLRQVFADKILPQLQEYFFGDFGKIGLVLGSKFMELANGGKKSDPFLAFPYDTDARGDYAERRLYRFTPTESWDLDAFRSLYATTT